MEWFTTTNTIAIVLITSNERFLLSIYDYKSTKHPRADSFYYSLPLLQKEKRGIWLLPVCYSRPTTALVVNRQSDTHASGIYECPIKVCMTAWLAVGTPTGRIYLPVASTSALFSTTNSIVVVSNSQKQSVSNAFPLCRVTASAVTIAKVKKIIDIAS